ncbi:MAG: plasmid pRiA4b ORF-3 family protein [Bacteroidales bacterium]|nr:plasmid pRiA4b ORF-3 family protein [Bacteroidales bacterium]
MTNKIYQVKITLIDSRPKIWRRLLIPSDLLLSDFHKVIQTSMGWTNSHLHQFIKNGTFYTERMPNDDLWYELNNVDYKKMKVPTY